jgi:hypothetical protein
VQLHFYLSTVYCGRWRILSHHALNADSPNVFCSRAGCGSVVPVFGSYYIYTHIKHVHIHTYLHSLAALACTTLSAFMLNACLHMLYFIPFRLPTLQFHQPRTSGSKIVEYTIIGVITTSSSLHLIYYKIPSQQIHSVVYSRKQQGLPSPGLQGVAACNSFSKDHTSKAKHG